MRVYQISCSLFITIKNFTKDACFISSYRILQILKQVYIFKAEIAKIFYLFVVDITTRKLSHLQKW